jgi:hypothetical protein
MRRIEQLNDSPTRKLAAISLLPVLINTLPNQNLLRPYYSQSSLPCLETCQRKKQARSDLSQ